MIVDPPQSGNGNQGAIRIILTERRWMQMFFDLVLDLLLFTLFPSILVDTLDTHWIHSTDMVNGLASTSSGHFAALQYRENWNVSHIRYS